MSITIAIIAELKAHAGLTAVLGTQTASTEKVFPQVAQQGTAFPFIVVNQLGEAPAHHHGGPMDLTTAQVQVDIYGQVYLNAHLAARQVKAAIDGMRATAIGSTPHRFFVQSSLLTDKQDLYERPSDGTQKGTHRVRMVFDFTHQQPT